MVARRRKVYGHAECLRYLLSLYCLHSNESLIPNFLWGSFT